MKKASKRRILFAARMATMVGAACFAVSGISETLGQEKEKSRPVYIATEEVAETTYTPEVEEATQPTETAKAVETEEPLIASMDWDKDDSYLLCKIAMAEAESEGVKGKALVMLVVLNRVWSNELVSSVPYLLLRIFVIVTFCVCIAQDVVCNILRFFLVRFLGRCIFRLSVVLF